MSDHDIYLQSVHSFNSSKNDETDIEYDAFPKHKFSVGMIHQVEDINYSVNYLYKSDFVDTIGSTTQLPSFHDVQVGMTWNISAFTVSLVIENLFDKEQVEPSIWVIEQGIYQNGRRLETQLSYSFN